MDPVVGGTPNELTGAGMSNIPHQQLAKRTRWLKAAVDALTAAIGSVIPSTRLISAAGLATGGGDLSADRTITVPKATIADALAGENDTKALTPLTGALQASRRVPRWRVTYDVDNTRVLPGAIVSAHPGYYGDYPSRGSIVGAGLRVRDTGSGGSYLFEMSLRAEAAVTLKQYVAYVDDALYAYINGALVGSVTFGSDGTERGEIEWPLVEGDNLLQIVMNDNTGDKSSLSLIGDLLSQSSGVSFVPM